MTAKFALPVSELRPFATPAELEAIEAIEAHGMNGAAAAAALGITHRALSLRLRTCRQRMASGRMPRPVPGYYAKQITTDRDGDVTAVQWRPEESPQAELPPSHVVKGISQLVDGEGREILRWTKTSQAERDRWDAFRAACAGLADTAPRFKPVKPPASVEDDLITVLPWGDPHIGMLSWATETGNSWDLEIAEEVTAQVMGDLVTRTPRSSEFWLCDLGDLFHAENDDQLTPHAKHKLDADGRAGKVVRVAVRIFQAAIDLALHRHGCVRVRLLRGNHDPYKCIALGMWLEAAYANEPRVVVEPYDNPYQAARWGECAFMWHHGDGSKPQQMPGVFSCMPEWQGAAHRYIHTGHIHSQNHWDFPGCTVESFRTLAPADYWAHWKGYRSQRTLDAITYDRALGEVSRVRQGIRRAK